MKIVIGYDGSAHAESVLDDLQMAGLPADTHALVVTIADPLAGSVDYRNPFTEEETTPIIASLPHSGRTLTVDSAEWIAKKGVDLLSARFPSWEIRSDPFAEDPAEGLLTAADQFAADLIVVGSHGRSALGRLVLGSVSRTVVNKARCSVRVARRHVSIPGSPLRLIIGVDGGDDSKAAVAAVADRVWPARTSVLLVTALPPAGASPNDSLPQWYALNNEAVRARVDEYLTSAREMLAAAGLNVDTRIRRKAPAEMLIDTAVEWGADSIFVGAREHGFLERLLVGSVSVSLATRAQCSVEIIRSA